MNNWVKWIFIDNNNYDCLRYHIGRLRLGSWSWFAIEMSVRWGALKRTIPKNYYLFGLLSGWQFNEFRLYKNTQHLCGGPCIGDFDNIKKVITDDNKFYKVISEYIRNWSGYTWNVYMYDWSKKIISREWIPLSWTPWIILYIW